MSEVQRLKAEASRMVGCICICYISFGFPLVAFAFATFPFDFLWLHLHLLHFLWIGLHLHFLSKLFSFEWSVAFAFAINMTISFGYLRAALSTHNPPIIRAYYSRTGGDPCHGGRGGEPQRREEAQPRPRGDCGTSSALKGSHSLWFPGRCTASSWWWRCAALK